MKARPLTSSRCQFHIQQVFEAALTADDAVIRHGAWRKHQTALLILLGVIAHYCKHVKVTALPDAHRQLDGDVQPRVAFLLKQLVLVVCFLENLPLLRRTCKRSSQNQPRLHMCGYRKEVHLFECSYLQDICTGVWCPLSHLDLCSWCWSSALLFGHSQFSLCSHRYISGCTLSLRSPPRTQTKRRIWRWAHPLLSPAQEPARSRTRLRDRNT